MSAFTVTAPAARVAPVASAARRSVVARAGGFTPDKTVGEEPVVFYTDKNGEAKRGTQEEYMAAKESNATYRASTVTGVLPEWAAGATADSTLQFSTAQAFGFSAPEGHVRGSVSGPELMNARLAMLAFVAAAPAEIASGQSVTQQFFDAPAAVLLTVAMVVAGSLISYQANTPPNPVGPFTKEKEILNGRAAMVGMAALIGIEAVKHTALL